MIRLFRRKRKALHIIIVTILFILAAGLISVCLVIHNYINKMNLIAPVNKINPYSEDKITAPEEDRNTSEPDSPKAEIETLEAQIRKNMEENSIPIMKDKDVLNILLIGYDSRNDDEVGRSDTMIIVSINKETKKIVATSMLRDIYLQIPGYNNNRINAAYAYGGADLLTKTIEKNFKIQIDRYVTMNFYSFIDIIDAAGGIRIEVTNKEIPIINNYIIEMNLLLGEEKNKDLLTGAGIKLLNGKQVLGYARNRYIGSDFERTARQRRVLEQLFSIIKSKNLVELNALLNVILPNVTTNLKEGEIFSFLLNLPSYKNYQLEQCSIPVKDTYSFLRIRGMSVIGIDFSENIKKINERIYKGD